MVKVNVKPTSGPLRRTTSKIAFLRSWGIIDENKLKAGFTWLRYKNPPEKGIYWYYFSLFVRQRDVERYGTCISCNAPITVETSQAGHFMPARDCGRDLLFNPYNVNAECGRCNAFDETHLLGYAENLDERYGAGTALKLRAMRVAYLASEVPVKDHKADEYAKLIKALPTWMHNDAVIHT